MIRKLRTSMNAMVLTAALCASGAFAVAAVPFAGAATAGGDVAAARADTGHSRAGTARRIRHQLAMPYFSFLPRS